MLREAVKTRGGFGSNHGLQPTALSSGREVGLWQAVAEPGRSILKRRRCQVVVESGLRVGTAVRSWRVTKANRAIGGVEGLVIGGVLSLRLTPSGHRSERRAPGSRFAERQRG